MGWRRVSQALKSPTTETARALGAQTAKRTPATPSMVIGREPSAKRQLEMPAFAEQIDIQVAQQTGRTNTDPQSPARRRASEYATGKVRRCRPGPANKPQRLRRQQRADEAAVLAADDIHAVRTRHDRRG